MNMETNPTQGFEKLQFLLQQNPFPPETFGNLLINYVKYEVSTGENKNDCRIDREMNVVLFTLTVTELCSCTFGGKIL